MSQIIIVVLAFLTVSALTLLVAGMARQIRRQRERVRKLVSSTDTPVRPESNSIGQAFLAMLPKFRKEEGASSIRLRTLMVQAGLYKVDEPNDEHLRVFLTVKAVATLLPPLFYMLGWLFRFWPLSLSSVAVALLMTVCIESAPTIWLGRRKQARQRILRTTLPDALDVIMICLEGGLTLSGALTKIATELRTVHPDLAMEMNIVQRHIQMGRSAGEALRQFANRCDLEEVRSLSSAVIQSEKFGASLVSSVRVQADLLCQRRLQHAEERA